jgi:integrase/recombinase XerD
VAEPAGPITSLSGQTNVDDATLVRLWLHGRPATTRATYAREIGKLRASLGGKALPNATLEDLQGHAERLDHLAPRSRALAVAAVKSFYDFHQRVGTLRANPAASLTAPPVPNDLAERIMTEEDTLRLIAAAPTPADRLALRLLYLGGLRAHELCGLRWRNLAPRDDGQGQVTVFGKGGKTRTVLVPAELWGALAARRSDQKPSDPVFGSPLDPARPMGQRHLSRIVKRAARAAGLSDKISAHWLRHAHGSHALDAGAPLTLVRDTLGHASIATTNRYLHSRPNDGSARYLKPG